MPDVRVEITADDMKIKDVLDKYYTFLKNVIGQQQGRVFLFNTITPFDTYDFSPLYNENVFRNFADLIVNNSPLEVDPRSGVNLRDKFSYYYARVVNEAAKAVEKKELTPEQHTEIGMIESGIDAKRDKKDRLSKDIADRWLAHAANLGLKPNTVEYDLEKINYYNTSGIATQVKDIFLEILENLAQIKRIKETSISPKYQILVTLDYIIRSEEFKMYRPYSPQLEKSQELDYWEFMKFLSNASRLTGLQGMLHRGEYILPFSNLDSIFKEGKRGIKIDKSTDNKEQHDVDWSVKSSGSYLKFFSGSSSASYSKKIKTAFTSANSFELNFENIDEFYVSRRDWYDSSIFEIDIVKEVIKSNPKFAANTRNVITSVIVGRGTSIIVEFSEKSHYEEMRKIKTSTGGRANFGFVSFGGKGKYSKYDYELHENSTNRSLTFADGKNNCRILGLKYDQVHTLGDDDEVERSFMLDADKVLLDNHRKSMSSAN